jgi:hypothetical protein|tara:strand:- start:925 stop:1458 length:534 start_codon:yes stop_codon:yes gene_type:complete
MTETFFKEQMSRLIGLRFVPGDMTTHWEALQDLPDDVLANAVGLAGRTRVDFPTPHQLRQDADLGRTVTVSQEIDRSAILDEPFNVVVPQTHSSIRITREWTYYCDHCSDSGWRSWWCGEPVQKNPWQSSQPCDSTRDHASHEWVEHCVCYSSNPALLRKRTAQQQYAVRETSRARA